MLIKINVLIVILLSGLVLTGCQSTTGFYKGAKAEEETVVALQANVKEMQHWTDLYVKVDYTLKPQGQRLLIDGAFVFADYPQGMMVRVDDFKLKLFLLDQDNRVLDYLDLHRTLGGALNEKMPFSKSIVVPPGTTAVSFGYEGEFFDEVGERDVVWKLPRRAI